MSDQSSTMQTLYIKIKQEIINQELKPGQRLPERELAEKYNVSRTPIRQILQQLSLEGLVEFVPYKGAFIKDLTIDEFKDITQLRMVLEKLAAEMSCDNPDDNVLQHLSELIGKQHKAIAQNDVKEYALLDQEFHYSIGKASNNKELIKFIELLNQKSYLSRIRTLSIPGQMERSVKEHQEILDCILSNDRKGAGTIASTHVGDALENYKNVHNIFVQFNG